MYFDALEFGKNDKLHFFFAFCTDQNMKIVKIKILFD